LSNFWTIYLGICQIKAERTKEETLERVKEAIQGYLESLQKDGIPTPRDVELEEVAVPA